MCKVSKWVLSLGILAVTPGVTLSGPLLPWSFSKEREADTSRADSEDSVKTSNQQVAEQIAAALRKARLDGFNIQIEYQDGVATVVGQVRDAKEKAKATHVVSGVKGVKRVDNRLAPLSQLEARSAGDTQSPLSHANHVSANGSAPWKLTPTSGTEEASELSLAPMPETEALSKSPRRRSNQEMAEEIAAALSSAKLNGYDIEIRYQDGTAVLTGSVANRQQWQQASRAVSSVDGVQNVQNRLRVRGEVPEGRPAPYGPYGPSATAAALPTALQQPAPDQPPMPPQGPPAPGQPPQGAQAGPNGAGLPAPPSYGHPGQGASHTVYNMPNVPEHAWPSYASYPNYAQVAYPKQYSASAWPYIGPFYPYPQVPMGWRQAQLEWDDGYWNLNFRPRTDKWWWFLHPENW